MKVALYARVSTEEQSEGQSPEVQKERLLAFAKAQGWEVVGTYLDDSTGLDTDRPGYRRFMADRGKWDVVAAVKGDRLHRSIDNARAFIKEMRLARKQVWTISEGRLDTDKNASAWIARTLTTELLPEFEARQISDRVLPSMERAKVQGLHQGRPPLGFYWVKRPQPGFVLTAWAEQFERDALASGLTYAREANPRLEGKLKGKILDRESGALLMKNIALYRRGQLLPNRERTASGKWSKFLP